jgi:predicted dehydrogenase
VSARSQQKPPFTVAVIGLEHGHATRVFNDLANSRDVKLVAIVDKDPALRKKYGDKFHLDPALFYDSLDAMLAALPGPRKPQAVLLYGPALEHRPVTEWAARHGIDVMMEKPFATTLADAVAMRDAGRKYSTRVLVNYETSWYSSNAEVMQDIAEGKLGTVRKVIIHDGHEGPAEQHSPPEFLQWLTDPVGNGAGALFDFGCYGADMMTVMRHGEAPLSVTAVAQTDKPEIYPKVDDDATIILRYPGLQAVLMPSWNWTFARKDMEVYGTKGIEIAVDPTTVNKRYDKARSAVAGVTTTAPPLPPAYQNSLEYFAALERGDILPGDAGNHDYTGIDTNIVAMQILDAARRSAKEGRTVSVTPVPK